MVPKEPNNTSDKKSLEDKFDPIQVKKNGVELDAIQIEDLSSKELVTDCELYFKSSGEKIYVRVREEGVYMQHPDKLGGCVITFDSAPKAEDLIEEYFATATAFKI